MLNFFVYNSVFYVFMVCMQMQYIIALCIIIWLINLIIIDENIPYLMIISVYLGI